MAKISATITNKQKSQFAKGEIIPRPILNTPDTQGVRSGTGAVSPVLPAKKKYVLVEQTGKIVATLIDKALAEKWVSEHKKGAIRFIESDTKAVS